MSAPSSSLSTTLLCALLLCTVQLIFAGYSVLTNAALQGAGGPAPLVFALLRDVTGSVLLLSAAYLHEGRRASPRFWVSREDRADVLLLGLLSVWGAQGCSALALANISPVLFAMLQPAMPVVTLALSLLLRLEAFNPRAGASWGKLLGIALTVVSAVCMVLFNSSNAGSDVRKDSKNLGLGIFYTGLQICLGGAYPVAQKPLLSRYSSVTLVAWGYVSGTGLLALSVMTSDMDAGAWALTPLSVGAIAYAGILSSAVAYGLLGYVNARSSPVLVSAFMPLQGEGGDGACEGSYTRTTSRLFQTPLSHSPPPSPQPS